MSVLMISTDRKILEVDSEVRSRVIEYGRLVEELHIIVLNQKSKVKNQNYNSKLKTLPISRRVSENVFVYPTNSRSKFFYICDAIKTGKTILTHRHTMSGNDNGGFIVTCQDPFETGFIGWRLAKKFGLHLQLQVHTDFLSPYFGAESFLNKIRVLLGKFLVKRANSIRVVSERIKNSLFDIGVSVDRITVLPIFVDMEKIKNAPIKIDLHKKYPQFDFIILMASRFSKEKNIEMAIGVMNEVVKQFPKAGLVIVGNGPEKKNYESSIADYELRENVVIENWTDDLSSYYKTADLFLLTSNYEGYGRTLAEATAVGCKIISSDVGIAPEILEKENIFAVGDKNGLIEKLIDAISGNIKPSKHIPTKTKEEYLAEYKKTWENK